MKCLNFLEKIISGSLLIPINLEHMGLVYHFLISLSKKPNDKYFTKEIFMRYQFTFSVGKWVLQYTEIVVFNHIETMILL